MLWIESQLQRRVIDYPCMDMIESYLNQCRFHAHSQVFGSCCFKEMGEVDMIKNKVIKYLKCIVVETWTPQSATQQHTRPSQPCTCYNALIKLNKSKSSLTKPAWARNQCNYFIMTLWETLRHSQPWRGREPRTKNTSYSPRRSISFTALML